MRFLNTLNVLLVMITTTKAQWTILPALPATIQCMGSSYNPNMIQPITDRTIIYTSLCETSVHKPITGYFLLSHDDLVSASQVWYTELVRLFCYNGPDEFAYTTEGPFGTDLYYIKGSYPSAPVRLLSYVTAIDQIAISPGYVNVVRNGGNLTVFGIAKSAASTRTINSPWSYTMVRNTLKFVNDSLGYCIAGDKNKLSKTALFKLTNQSIQMLSVDSIDAFVDITLTPSGDLYLLKSSGTVLKSMDNGATFRHLQAPPSGNYSCMAFLNGVGFLGGSNGLLVRTLDDGLTWDTENSNTSANISAVYLFNSEAYFVSNAMFRRDMPTGVATGDMDKKLAFHPNPANGTITIDMPDVREGILTLTDMMGRKIRQVKVKGSADVDVSNISEGVYVIQYSDVNGTITSGKLIVAR